MIILRFVHCNDPISNGIILQTGGLYSHVEAMTPDGKYLGARADSGVEARSTDYDKDKFDRQRILQLTADEAMTARFYHYLNAVIGEPYDFGAIAGFAVHANLHEKAHTICSALQALALRGCLYFPNPLSVRAHEISPRDLELVLSSRADVREIQIS